MYENLSNITDIWDILADKYKDKIAVVKEETNYRYSFKELKEKINIFSSFLIDLKLKKDEKIALFASNHPRWIVCDQAIMKSGFVCVPRDVETPLKELETIYKHSDACILITDNERILNYFIDNKKILDIKQVIYIGENELQNNHKEISTYNEIIKTYEKKEIKKTTILPSDIAAIFYTTGTIGDPKGAVLTHLALLERLKIYDKYMDYNYEENFISILPLSHVAPRFNDFSLLLRGNTIYHTSYKKMFDSLKKHKPTYIFAVPKLIEEIKFEIRKKIQHNNKQKIKNKYFDEIYLILSFLKKITKINLISFILGKTFYNAICDIIEPNVIFCVFGAALSKKTQDFFENFGIKFIGTYGSTETANIAFSTKKYNKSGCVGKICEEVELKIIEQETNKELGYNKTGEIIVRSKQGMNGYYKENSKEKLYNNFLHTGDLGEITKDHFLKYKGRIKDIIVLSNGKNIEILQLENIIKTSKYVNQIVITGQDKPYLTALIVPEIENMKNWAKKNKIKYNEVYDNKDYKKEIIIDINNLIDKNSDLRYMQFIRKIKLLKNPFTIKNGLLTIKSAPRRQAIYKKYENEINKLYE